MQLKIVAYNVWRGFHSKPKLGKEVEVHLDRVEAAREVMRQIEPDILMITEACLPHYNNHGVHLDYQDLFGLEYQVEKAGEHSKHGNIILSRYPLEEGESKRENHFKHARAVLSLPHKKLTLDLVHPPAVYLESERVRNLQNVINGTKSSHILAGDLNSFSPEDNYDWGRVRRTQEKILGNKKMADRVVDDLITKKAVRAVKEAGLIDTYRIFHKGTQTRTVPTVLRDGGDDGGRIDYIFASADVKVTGAGIYTKAPAKLASDHFPVWATIEV